MARCKDCIHFGICKKGFPWADGKGGGWCEDFKSKADYADVVRCKDCRYAYINFFSANSGVALCRHWTNHAEGKQAIMQHDDFCSYGERREGE